MENKKLQRMEYLAKVLRQYQTTEPPLTLKDIAEVLSMEVGDVTNFLKVYKKELCR